MEPLGAGLGSGCRIWVHVLDAGLYSGCKLILWMQCLDEGSRGVMWTLTGEGKRGVQNECNLQLKRFD